MALEQHPLQTRKAPAASTAALQLRNLESNLLPRIAFNAAGSRQSDVFRLPIDNPLFPIPEIPRDQYKVTVDVAERIWDGGSDRFMRRQIALDQAIADVQADVDIYQINQIITELYGGILTPHLTPHPLLTHPERIPADLPQSHHAAFAVDHAGFPDHSVVVCR